MRVLIITGDKRFVPGNPRYELQKSAVERLEVLYWGRGQIVPRVPGGSFDVVTAQDPFFRGHLGGHIAWLKGAKLNIQVHADLDAQPVLRRMFARVQLRHADSIRVVSKKIQQQVEQIGVRAPITVLPVFVDISRFQPIKPQPHAQKTILWVGRFEDEKDPLRAIEVFKRVHPSIDAKLVMLGKGSLETTLKAAAAGLPVEFPGWQDPAAFLPQADVVLCTSKYESWGASIVEALAAGVPVVAPDVGIAAEAGAIVVAKDKLPDALVEVLHSGAHGQFRLAMPGPEEWARAWVASL
jgi:glycosyltransferase involved in cell wall biosynthesis